MADATDIATPHIPFVHIHTHTEYSFLDGAIKIKDLVKQAKKWNMPAAAITDHGGLFGAMEFHDKMSYEGIKPILGFEAYVAPTSRKSRNPGEDKRSAHLVLLAKNQIGWKNLMKLSSAGYMDGFYYKPRIDMDLLREYGSGLIATSACIGGAIPVALAAGDKAKAKLLTEEFLRIFGEGNFFFELQRHGMPEEEAAYPAMIELGREMGVPLIVANDAHYLRKEDAKAHEILLCIQTGAKMSDTDRMKFCNDEFYFKSPEEMAALFPELPEAISNTVMIANMCDDVTPKNKAQMPSSGIPVEYTTEDDYLRALSEEGLKRKYPEITDKVRERMEYELKVITSMGFSGYYLIVRDFMIAADRMGIFRGCRGSAAGSIIAYLIDITYLDPLKFDLLFERFLNPERISMPDVDADFADNDRAKVIDYVLDKYGADSVCQIINFGRMKAKAAVKDVARVMGLPIADANRVSKMIPEDPKMTIEKALKDSPDLKAEVENNPAIAEIVTYAQTLEGVVRQPGVHAAGVIIAPADVRTWAPLYKQSSKNEEEVNLPVTQFDMKYVENSGLIKMDFLGLRTLTVQQEACLLVEKYHGVKVDVWQIPEGDEKTYQLFHRGETNDIFQFESQGMQGHLRKLKPTRVEDLIAMAALYRPGPMANIDSFVARKHGREEIKYPHPMLKDVLDVTYGIIVYQEQVMRIAQMMGGFTLGMADALRKAMGKKDHASMDKLKPKFMEGAAAQSINATTADEVWALMCKFAEYGFNKAHAAVYAHISYQAAWLKVHYTREYMTAVLTSYLGRKDDFLAARNEAERLGLKLLPPDVNRSEIKCSIDEGNVRMGLCAIANVGKAAEVIITERAKNGPFRSLFDLCTRADLRLVNKKALESLIAAGAFDGMYGSSSKRSQLFASVDKAVDYGNTVQRDKESGQTSLFGGAGAESVVIPEPELPLVPELPLSEILNREKTVLNFYMSGHPLDHYYDELRSCPTMKLTEESFKNTPSDTSVVVGGMILSVKVIMTKKGDQMAICEIEDLDGTVEVTFFPEKYKEFREMCAVDKSILVRGKFQHRDEGRFSVLADNVKELKYIREALTSSVGVRLRTELLDEAVIADIYAACEKAKPKKADDKAVPLFLIISTKEGVQYRVKSKNLSVSPEREALALIREKVGKENVWLEGARKRAA